MWESDYMDRAVDCKTRALELIQHHEGKRLDLYKCPADKWTIGYGRNLEDKGITDDEAMYLLSNDIDECMTDLQEFDWWLELDPARQSAIIDMRYNLGATGFRGFIKMINALSLKDYGEAAKQIVDSKAGRSELVGLRLRYQTLATIMRNGF